MQGSNYNTISNHFAVGRSNVSKCVHDVSRAIILHVFKAYIRLPTQAEAQWSMRAWQTQTGIPGIVCAIDGTHIAIPRPCYNGETFYNRKNFYSLIVQGELNWPHH